MESVEIFKEAEPHLLAGTEPATAKTVADDNMAK